MPRPERLIFLCTNVRPAERKESCAGSHAGAEIAAAFRKRLKERGLSGRLRAAATSCLGPCTGGPHAVVMPDNIWYSGFQESDIDAIIDEHLLGGQPVARLLAPTDS